VSQNTCCMEHSYRATPNAERRSRHYRLVLALAGWPNG
jgi:hypothetical protein